jgi:IS1 family transposase
MILRQLLEGSGIRNTERLTWVHRDTIMGLLVYVGERCQRFLEETVRNVQVQDVQADEIRGFVSCKEKTRLRRGLGGGHGDAYCFVALERKTKLVLAWHPGKRSVEDTLAFADKLWRATEGRFQLRTDGHKPYQTQIPFVFGRGIDFAVLVKVYGTAEEDDHRYTPARLIGTDWFPCSGNPDMNRVCTSHVERAKLSMRMTFRRLTRLTNAFSKKWENHEAALVLYFGFYNYCRPHQTSTEAREKKTTPAMETGLTDHVWRVAELLEKVSAVGAANGRAG